MYSFSEKEIDQVLDAFGRWSSIHPYDRRKYTKKVQEWMYTSGLAVQQCRHGTRVVWPTTPWPWDCPKSGGRKCTWRLYPNADSRAFLPERDLPIEALWKVVESFLYFDDSETPRGYSVNKHSGWLKLNIWPQGNKWETDESWRRRLNTMMRLDAEGYLVFRSAGNVWSITVR